MSELLNFYRHRYIKIGSLHLPAPVAFEKLSFCVRPIGAFEKTLDGQMEFGIQVSELNVDTREIENEFSVFPRRIGSTVLLEYRGAYFAIFTQHQFDQISESKNLKDSIEQLWIFVEYPEGTSNLPVETALIASQESDDDLNDIVVAVISRNFLTEQQRTLFFPVALQENIPTKTNVIAAGYRYDAKFDTLKHALSLHDITCFSGELEGYSQNQKSMFGVLKCKADGNSFDGMSGGGVFSVELNDETFKLSFVGMIIRGGGEYIYFLNNQRIIGILQDYTDGKSIFGDI